LRSRRNLPILCNFSFKCIESHWWKLFAILGLASPHIGQECAPLCSRIKVVLALYFGHVSILKACMCQSSVENASFLILRASLGRLLRGTGCSSLYRVSILRRQETIEVCWTCAPLRLAHPTLRLAHPSSLS
jgi:hypothetical protein